MLNDFAIGDLARKTGVKITTIRYYESIGLLAPPPRTAAGRRVYGEAHFRRLNFIRYARDLGFEVDAIRELLKVLGIVIPIIPKMARCEVAFDVPLNCLLFQPTLLVLDAS